MSETSTRLDRNTLLSVINGVLSSVRKEYKLSRKHSALWLADGDRVTLLTRAEVFQEICYGDAKTTAAHAAAESMWEVLVDIVGMNTARVSKYGLSNDAEFAKAFLMSVEPRDENLWDQLGMVIKGRSDVGPIDRNEE